MIFGITLRVLTLLSDQLGVPLPMIEEIPQLRRAPAPRADPHPRSGLSRRALASPASAA